MKYNKSKDHKKVLVTKNLFFSNWKTLIMSRFQYKLSWNAFLKRLKISYCKSVFKTLSKKPIIKILTSIFVTPFYWVAALMLGYLKRIICLSETPVPRWPIMRRVNNNATCVQSFDERIIMRWAYNHATSIQSCNERISCEECTIMQHMYNHATFANPCDVWTIMQNHDWDEVRFGQVLGVEVWVGWFLV